MTTVVNRRHIAYSMHVTLRLRRHEGPHQDQQDTEVTCYFGKSEVTDVRYSLVKNKTLCEIRGSYGGDYKDYYRLGCDAV
jgi:hypothetical protein